MRREVIIGLVLAAITLAVFWPVSRHEFIAFDDQAYVTENPHVRTGLNWENVRWAFTNREVGLWHPLTWLSHMLDCRWFGLRAGGHHLTSLLLHAANAVLLFAALRALTGELWRSAWVAAFFALHPLHVESVAWIAERKDVLSTFFALWTLWAYSRYARANGARPATYALMLLCYGCALMSKPMVVTLPLILLLLDYWPLKRFPPAAGASQPATLARLVIEKLPLIGLALLTMLVTLGAAARVHTLPSVAQCPIANRIANATISYARYLLQTFWPADLAVFYPFPAAISVWSVAGAALLLLAISAAALGTARRRPFLAVGWLWYGITLLPVVGLIQLGSYSHADRYTYVPLIGLFIMVAWGIGEIRFGSPVWRFGLVLGATLLLGACGAATRFQLKHWQNTAALFARALEVAPRNPVAHHALGSFAGGPGQYGCGPGALFGRAGD